MDMQDRLIEAAAACCRAMQTESHRVTVEFGGDQWIATASMRWGGVEVEIGIKNGGWVMLLFRRHQQQQSIPQQFFALPSVAEPIEMLASRLEADSCRANLHQE